ncbi:MAG: hypothetical protein ACKVPZ_11935 [Burkholderiaceae bacterium]
MIDWINAVLRTVMCLGFLLLVVRPMLLAFSRKEVDRLAIEDAAQSSVNSAFNAWRIHNGRHYYDNPEYAEMMASNPNLELPDLSKPAPKPVPEPEVVIEPPVAETPAEPPVEEVAVEQALAEVAQAQPEAAPAQDVVVSPEENEEDEEEDPVKAMKARLAAEKKKAKPPSIPPELMNNANSFDDKLMLVQMIVQQEQGRVAGVLKKMIQGG